MMTPDEYKTVPVILPALWASLMETTKVLLVEDDPLTRHLVRKSLLGECIFVTASSAESAIRMCESFHPDVIFLDLGLPDAPGHTVLDWVTANDPTTTVVLFTQSHDFQMIDDLISNGANGYICKPFVKQDLVQHLWPQGTTTPQGT